MRIINVFLGLILIAFLTVVTQVGGIVFLISILFFGIIDRRLSSWWSKRIAKVLTFVILYFIFVFVLIPLIAKPFGRVSLPVFETEKVKPANIWTCLLNRHYVRPGLKDITFKVAERMSNKYPGITINYLDANFPFIDKFPLLPHLSHNDGKKLDLSFQYNDIQTGQLTNDIPSFIGYGVCEEPKDDEVNKGEDCGKKGYWQYSLLRDVVSQSNKGKFIFDNDRTRELVNLFASHEAVQKIFIEPHLKTRLGLTSGKIRFHGCQAVRHDDHIHVQLR